MIRDSRQIDITMWLSSSWENRLPYSSFSTRCIMGTCIEIYRVKMVMTFGRCPVRGRRHGR